jgi:DNA-directed RNA polymerase III subunit RPC5
MEVDVPLSTAYNFNKYQSLQWGDALKTGKEVQNETATYGLAGGIAAMKPRAGGRVQLKDRVDRENQILNDLASGFYNAEAEGRAMRTQTLGGQIVRHGSEEEGGKPLYFVGAFRENQLHLTKVDGTAQMRPQFHHIDAEEQRAKLAASRASALEEGARPAGEARGLQMRQSLKIEESEKDKLELRMRTALQAAEAECWTRLEYVDEDMEDAYEKFRERMFVKDTEDVPKLKSGMQAEEYLDAVSAPRKESPTRRRKRPPRRKRGEGEEEAEAEEGDHEDDEG